MTVYVKQSVIDSLAGIIPKEVLQRWQEKKEIVIEGEEKHGN